MTNVSRRAAMGPKLQNRLLSLLVIAFFMTGLFSKCANPMAPSGGLKDTLPPIVMSVSPAHGTVNFDQKRINLTFDEYVKLQDLQKEFFVSPFMGRKPSVTIRGRGIQIDLQDTLKENMTYSLNFGNSIRDNNEGNPLNGLRYVFSTGERVDSMIMSGYTADAQRGDSVGNVYIMFYPDSEYPLNPDYDSTLFNTKAQSVSKSAPNGVFLAQNLKPVNYRMYALHDINNNQTYEPGTDRVAFIDSILNPAHMPGFDIWYDTIRKYPVAQPQTLFRLFMDEGFRRQYLAANKRTMKQKIELHFNAPHPIFDTLRLDGISDENIIIEYPTVGKDTVFLWLNVPPADLADTIKGRISYFRHDSINNLVRVGQDLTFGWFEREETRAERRDRETLEKEIEDAVAKGGTSPRKPNPFKYQVRASSELIPHDNIVFEFDHPLLSIDSANIELVRVEGEKIFDIAFGLEQDTVNIRKWTLSAPWIVGKSYKLLIPFGALTDIARHENDTLRSEFKIASLDKFATLELNIRGKTPESQYTLQVISATGSLIKEIRHATTGKHIFQYLSIGKVKIRVLEDANGNGVWDRGDLIKRIQPERMEIYVGASGEEEMELKMDWEMSMDIDMEAMFAPMTMERLARQLEARDAAKLRQFLKNKERSQSRQSSTRPQGSNQGTGANNGSEGGMFGSSGLQSLPGFNR